MRTKILVTRPEPGLSHVMERLISLNKDPVAAPMLQIETLPPLEKISGNVILVTSVHALSALENQDRNCRILAVGNVTANKAKLLGFKDVFSAEGNAEKLKDLYEEMGYSSSDSWLATGCGNNGKLYGDFLVENLGIRRIKTYQVKWETVFSDQILAFFRHDGTKQILFYSSETVRSFLSLIEIQEREFHFKIDRKQIEIFCFSSAIATVVKNDPRYSEWRKIQDNLREVFEGNPLGEQKN